MSLGFLPSASFEVVAGLCSVNVFLSDASTNWSQPFISDIFEMKILDFETYLAVDKHSRVNLFCAIGLVLVCGHDYECRTEFSLWSSEESS